jgi:hypothetical protein
MIITQLDHTNNASNTSSTTTNITDIPNDNSASVPANVIEQVGEEYIFTTDINNELNLNVDRAHADKKAILAKLITDSIVIQGALKDNLFKFDPNDPIISSIKASRTFTNSDIKANFYNSSNKDPILRLMLINKITELINSESNIVSGSMVSIWCNNDYVGNLTLEQRKTTAYNKIKPIYDQVKNKSITMKQAGDIIINDSSLVLIDKAYKTNAYATFEVKGNDEIFFDSDFDKVIRTLKAGEITELKLLKDPTQNNSEAVYIFAAVDKIVSNSIIGSYDSWLALQTKNFSTKSYKEP